MENQISAAENALKELEDRVFKIESQSASKNELQIAEDAVKAYQSQLLGRLKEIRDAFQSEGGDIISITKERDLLKEENKQLKKEMERMQYRIKHLIKALNEEEAKSAENK